MMFRDTVYTRSIGITARGGPFPIIRERAARAVTLRNWHAYDDSERKRQQCFRLLGILFLLALGISAVLFLMP